MKKYLVFIGLCMALMIFHVYSFAETINLEEIIVRGEREVGPEESLEIREVRETPARDVGEALKGIEGISSIRKGAIANDIVLRGFQKDNLNVLVDGARIYGACPNRMDPNSFHVDFAEIEEVSVLKGPFDVKNPGSLGGLIEIKTIKPREGLGGSINALGGSYEDIATSANATYGDKNMDFLFGYAYKYSLPFKDGDGKRITEQYPPSSRNRYKSGEEDNKAYSINTYWTKWGFNLPSNQRVEIAYTRQEADDVIYPYLLMDAVYDDTDRLHVKYEVSDPFKGVKKLKAGFYWNQVKHDMTDWRRESSSGSPSGYSMKTYAESGTSGGKMEGDFQLHSGILTVGVDYYLRNWDSDTTLMTGTQDSIPDVDTEDMGTYLEYTRPITENAGFTVGARFDHVRTEAHGDRSALYSQYHGTTEREETDSYVGGNAQIFYSPVKRIELSAGFGQTTRPPDAVERYFALEKPMAMPNWVGNPGLEPSKNRELDLGIKYSGDRLLGKATFFYSRVEDFITIFNLQKPGLKSARSYRNVDATLYGGEISLNISLPLHLNLQGGISYTRGDDDTFDKPLSEIPPLKGRVAMRYETNGYFSEIEGIFTDDQHRIDPALKEEETSGWGVINFKAGMKYKGLSIFAGVENVFDRLYFEHLSYQRDPFSSGVNIPEIGRNFYLHLTWTF